MFWIIAAIIALVTALAIVWPMFRHSNLRPSYLLALVFFVPVAALFMYKDVGTPSGISVTGTPQQQPAADHASQGQAAGDMGNMIGQLERRLQENPADVDGWILLGRSYKAMQQYAQAETALMRAIQLAPENPLVMVELAEAKLFSSGQPTIGPEVKGQLELALSLDPTQQKALWLLGIAATQSGDDALAVELWENLVSQMEPGSPSAGSIQAQIDQAKTRLGEEIQDGAWPGIDIQVTVDQPGYTTPPGAVLFVIARNPLAPGPPVGVKRISNPVFPVNVRLSDSDSMMQEMPVSALGSLQLLARLSMSGTAIPGMGDLASVPLEASLDQSDSVLLELSASAQ